MLRLWRFRPNKMRENVRREGTPFVYSETLGLVQSFTQQWYLSQRSRRHPAVLKLLCRWLRSHISPQAKEFAFTSVTINAAYSAKRHRDAGNVGPSIVKAFGEFSGGELMYWPGDRPEKRLKLEELSARDLVTLDVKENLVLFDGNRAHEVCPFDGERYSVVFFARRGYENVPMRLQREYKALNGYFPAPRCVDRMMGLLGHPGSALPGFVQWPDAPYSEAQLC